MGLVYVELYERIKFFGMMKKFVEFYGFFENDLVLIKEVFKKVVNVEYSDLMVKFEGKGEEKEEEVLFD